MLIKIAVKWLINIIAGGFTVALKNYTEKSLVIVMEEKSVQMKKKKEDHHLNQEIQDHHLDHIDLL